MRLKNADWKQVRKWKKEHEERGYFPHYHRIGRVKMEVRFLRHQPREVWAVLNIVTNHVHVFRRNGTPLNGTRGFLIGPIVIRRKVKKCSVTQ